MNVGYPNAALSRLARESEMPIVVYDPRKGKSVVSEGALLKIKLEVTWRNMGIVRQKP